MKKLETAFLLTNEKLPEIGETVLSAIIVDGDVVIVDQHGKLINGLKSATINSTVESGKNSSLITLTVRSHRD